MTALLSRLRLHTPMQTALPFQHISLDEALLQGQRIAEEVAAQPRKPPPIKRPVGRPPKRPLVDAAAIMAAAAAAFATTSETPSSNHKKARRGSYTNWFANPALVRVR